MPLPAATIVYRNEELLPAAWAKTMRSRDAYVFNPSIASYRDSLLLIYRVVLPDLRRRVAVCRLDESLQVITGSVVPLSDYLEGAGDWHADPRFCIYGDRLLVHFNTGMPANGANDIFVIELDADSLRPHRPARPLILGRRRTIEKNWMLFEHDAGLYAVYEISPHVVLRVNLGPDGQSGPVDCRRISHVTWDASAYARRYGQLRGGTPPILHQNVFYTFFHSTYPTQLWRTISSRLCGHPVTRRTYVGGFYGFAATPPFAPAIYIPFPVLRPPSLPWRHRKRLDPGVRRFVYPGGALLQDGLWRVASGVQQEYCCVTSFAHDDLLASSTACLDRGTAA